MPGSGGAPVEVTVCHPTETISELVNRRFYNWTSPMARGVDLLHQLTDVLGIAVGGIEGNRVMGFGFPDQTLIWDGSALQNTTGALMEEQSPLLPMLPMLPMRTMESQAVSTAAWRPPRPSKPCRMRPQAITSPA